eukprot:1155861-Rhodomonas_salina.2
MSLPFPGYGARGVRQSPAGVCRPSHSHGPRNSLLPGYPGVPGTRVPGTPRNAFRGVLAWGGPLLLIPEYELCREFPSNAFCGCFWRSRSAVW